MNLSLEPVVDALEPAFTQPSYGTACELLLAWVMCLGKHTLRRVAHNADPSVAPDHSRRHGLDSYHNYFARSAWTPKLPVHHRHTSTPGMGDNAIHLAFGEGGGGVYEPPQDGAVPLKRTLLY